MIVRVLKSTYVQTQTQFSPHTLSVLHASQNLVRLASIGGPDTFVHNGGGMGKGFLECRPSKSPKKALSKNIPLVRTKRTCAGKRVD